MDTPDTVSAKPKGRGPISQILSPIRGRLIVAAALAGCGSMLTLVPLAGIAHIASLALGDSGIVSHEVWWVVIAGIASLCLGMLLISAAELLATWLIIASLITCVWRLSRD